MKSINDRCFLNKIVFNKSSLKDDDSGDHDQDQGSPKDSEKEKNEDEDKEQNVSKKKVSSMFAVFFVFENLWGKKTPCTFKWAVLKLFTLRWCWQTCPWIGGWSTLVDCRWWFQGQVSTLFSTTTPSGTPDAPQGDQPAPRATNRILNRLAALPRYVHFHKFDLKQTQPISFNSNSCWLLSLLRWSSSGVSIVTWSVQVTWRAIVTFTSSRRA